MKNPMKWNISLIGGKENNHDFVSTGEGKWRKKNIDNIF